MAQTTTAKFTSKCHECGLLIAPGEDIEPGYRSFRHADCTQASTRRQVAAKVASGATQQQIWTWLNNTPQMTMDEKIDAIYYAKEIA
jgi:hypothetical protein